MNLEQAVLRNGRHLPVILAALATSLCAPEANSAPRAGAPAAEVVATAADIEEIAPGLFRSWEKLSHDWALLHFTKDKAGKTVVGCDAVKLTGSEIGLRVSVDKASRALTYGFMGVGTGLITKPVKVTYWFDDDRAGAQTVDARIVKSPDDMEWLSASQSGGETGLQDKLRTLTKITFAYLDEDKRRNQAFPLVGANTALEKLYACIGSN